MLNGTKYGLDDVKLFILNDCVLPEHICLQKYIYKTFAELDFPTHWITTEEVLLIEAQNPAFYYILVSFAGIAFEHLKNLKCKVYGSFLISYCLENNIAIPKWSHPLFSFALSGSIVCFSGIESAMKEQTSELVEYMSGIVSGPLISDCTHLIVEELTVISEKVRCAKQMQIPVVTLNCVLIIWKLAQNNQNMSKCSLDDYLEPTMPVTCSAEFRGKDTSHQSSAVRKSITLSSSGCFDKMTFRLLFLPAIDCKNASNLIESMGGMVIHSQNDVVDILICPLLIEHGVDFLQKYGHCKDLCSDFWLMKCAKENIFLSPKSNGLFRPITMHANASTLFTSCVVALSGLNVLERATYENMLKVHGAMVQNALAKKTKTEKGETFYANTHMIVNSDNKRAAVALSWKIHVLCPLWVVDSILQNKRLPEDSYRFGYSDRNNVKRSDALWCADFENNMNADTSPVRIQSAPETEKEQTNQSLNEVSHNDRSNFPPDTDSIEHVDHGSNEREVQVREMVIGTPELSNTEKGNRLENNQVQEKFSETRQHLFVNDLNTSHTPSNYLNGDRKFNLRFTVEENIQLEANMREMESQNGDDENADAGFIGKCLERASVNTKPDGSNYDSQDSTKLKRLAQVEKDDDGWIVKPMSQRPVVYSASQRNSKQNGSKETNAKDISKKSLRKRPGEGSVSQKRYSPPSLVVLTSPSKKKN